MQMKAQGEAEILLCQKYKSPFHTDLLHWDSGYYRKFEYSAIDAESTYINIVDWGTKLLLTFVLLKPKKTSPIFLF